MNKNKNNFWECMFCGHCVVERDPGELCEICEKIKNLQAMNAELLHAAKWAKLALSLGQPTSFAIKFAKRLKHLDETVEKATRLLNDR